MPTPSAQTVPTASHKDVSAIKHLTEHNDSNLLPPSRPLPLSCQWFDGVYGRLRWNAAWLLLPWQSKHFLFPVHDSGGALVWHWGKTNYPAWLLLPWACTYPLKQSTRLITMTMPADNAVCTSTSERQDRLGKYGNENTRERALKGLEWSTEGTNSPRWAMQQEVSSHARKVSLAHTGIISLII